MVQEEIPVMVDQFLKNQIFALFWGPDSIWMLLDHVYALWTWYILSGHGLWSLDMVYSCWTWYTVFEHGICLLDLEMPARAT